MRTMNGTRVIPWGARIDQAVAAMTYYVPASELVAAIREKRSADYDALKARRIAAESYAVAR